MTAEPDLLRTPHDPRDPNPWLATYLDASVPIDDAVKRAWLDDCSSKSRQFLLPVVRPFARMTIVLIQLLKTVVPNAFTSSRVLHRLIAWGLRTFVRPGANWLILRHLHCGAETLAFIAANAGVEMPPLHDMRLRNLDALRDDAFLRHDLNLFNFLIYLNRGLREQGRELAAPDRIDFAAITDGPFAIDEMPDRWTNFIDLQTAIELYTPVYQLFLTDNDFWRSTNSLQLDETIALYAAKILGDATPVMLVNNRHPLVPLSTLRAGHRLVLHGVASEMLHELLVRRKREQAADDAQRAAR